MADSRQHEDRAPRMDIQLPLRYRELGEQEWFDSATSNISRTGVLFHGSRIHQAGSVVQIDLRLPVVKKIDEEGAQFVSFGRVVRSIQQGEGDRCVALAVQFLEYQFSRGSGSDS